MNFLKWTSKKIGNFRRGNAVYNLIPYVLIGGGTASYYASMTIRARDPDARVLIIGQEEETPYRRSVLSKELWWYGDAESSSTFSYISPINNKRRYGTYEADGFYFLPEELDQWEHGGIAFMSGAKVDKVDAENNFVQLENGQKIEFEKCLIATGSASPFKDLASDPDLAQHISVLHDVNDYRKLHKKMEELNNAAENNKNIVILGGGLLGAELAYSLNRRYARDNEGSKLRIIQVAQEHGILSEILPQSLSDHSTETLRSQGVELILGTSVDAITRRGNKILLTIAPNQQQISGTKEEPETLQCDHLILANDVEPQIELVEKSNLTIDKKNGGVLADSLMHVKGNIWAAGDVCSFFDETLGYRRRCAHWQHAQITGRIAGENMTSGNKTYTHQGAFVTMLGPKAHICGIGDTNPNKFDSNVVLSEKDSSNNEPRAIVFYTDRESKKIKGILLYNVLGFGEEMARKLIRDMHPFNESAAKEYTKLFELWEADDGSAAEKIEGESLLTDEEVDAYQRRED